jgi:hypothetical protein
MPTCPVCRGTKKVRLLGMMSGDCDFCDASGSVTREKLDKQKADFVVPAPIEKLELPANHAQNAKDAIKEQLRQANVGYRAQPIEIKKDAPQNDGMTEAQRISAAKAQIKPRADDMMAAQSVDSVDTSKEHVEIKPKNAQVKHDKAKQAKG